MRRVSCYVLLICFGLTAGNLSLHKAQEILFENNLEIAAGKEEIKKSSAELAQAKSAWYPSVDALASFNYTTAKGKIHFPFTVPGMGPNATVGQNDRTELGVDLSYPVFTGFARTRSILAAHEGVVSKEASLGATKNRASLIMGILYYRWSLSYTQQEVFNELSDHLKQYAEQVQILYEGGMVPRARPLEAMARYRSSLVDLLYAQEQTDSLKREVLGILQYSDSAIVPESGSVDVDTFSIPETIDTTRPELVSLDRSIRQLAFNRDAVFGQRLPQIAGSVGFRSANPGLSIGTNEFMQYAVFGAQLRWNIYDGMKNSAQREQISHQIGIVRIQKKRLLDDEQRSLAFWSTKVNSSQARIETAELSVKAAAQLALEQEDSYKAGTSTETDYLNALSGLAQARLALAQAKFAKRTAILNSIFASGKKITF